MVEWGAGLRRAGRRRDARRALLQGLDTAARCGARPLIAYAREELRVAGARPRRVDRTRDFDPDPGDLGVARLSAGGDFPVSAAFAVAKCAKGIGRDQKRVVISVNH